MGPTGGRRSGKEEKTERADCKEQWKGERG
jgi:hypothetical protein